MKMMKKSLFTILALCLLLTGCSANNTVKTPEEAKDYPVDSTLSAEEVKVIINNVLFDWSEQTIDYISAIEILHKYSKSEDSEISSLAAEYIDYIDTEHFGYLALTEAQDLFKSSEYAKAMNAAMEVSEDYSQKKYADIVYENSEKIILLLVSAPTSEKDYEDAMLYLDNCLAITKNQKFELRKNELIYEYDILKHVNKIIDVAQEQYESKQFKTSFETLEQGILAYPENVVLKDCLTGFQELFVIEVFDSVESLCEQKKYKEATKIVTVAKENLDCEEFDLLAEAVKERSNGIYKFGKDLVRYFDGLANKWESEELTVEKVAENAGNYVVKSGKKLFLGDYSEDNVTVLSFGTNIVAALAGLDLAFDIRDLSYDFTHWGEDKYFMLYLAADVVAIIPVIGAIKYFKYFDKASDGVKDIAKVADDIADSAKTLSKTADIIDEMATAAKSAGKISDVIDEATTVAKSSDTIAEAVDQIQETSPVFKKMINSDLDGKVHASGVEFESKTLFYTYDEDLIGVFPKFDSKFEHQLAQDLWRKSDAEQFAECNKALYESIMENKQLKSLFSDEEIDLLKQGKSPSNWKWTWHHNEEEGLMQLVESSVHSSTGHTGGRNLWGGGTPCRATGCTLPVGN